jgi:phage recombination protein Bet
MSNAIVAREANATVQPILYSQEQTTALKKLIFGTSNVSDVHFDIFLAYSERLGLDPFTKSLYAYETIARDKDKKLVIGTGIDGYREIAHRTGLWEGTTAPEYLTEAGKWIDGWTKDHLPIAARVGIYRKGFRNASYFPIYTKEFLSVDVSGNASGRHADRPLHMLAIRAEVHGLRQSFSKVLSGISVKGVYTEEITPETPWEERLEGRIASCSNIAQFQRALEHIEKIEVPAEKLRLKKLLRDRLNAYNAEAKERGYSQIETFKRRDRTFFDYVAASVPDESPTEQSSESDVEVVAEVEELTEDEEHAFIISVDGGSNA